MALALLVMVGSIGLVCVKIGFGEDGGTLRLEDVLLMMKVDNEQILQRDINYSFTAEFAEKIKEGKKVTPSQLDFGKRRCEFILRVEGTPKKRAKLLRKMMRQIDDDILMAVDRIQGIDEYDGRRISIRCRRRLESLFEYSAQKHAEYLEVFNSVK